MSMEVIVVGAVALGPKAAVRLKRLRPEARVVMIDRDERISYGGCGIPYFISGDVSDPAQLMTTSFHMVRDAEFFRRAKGVEVLSRTEVLAVERPEKRVRIRSLVTGEESRLPYDKLVLATGSRPRRLGVPGEDLANVFTVSGLNEAIRIKETMTAGRVERAVVVGGGPIGLEIAAALADLWDIETTVIEIADQVLPGMIGPILAHMVQDHLAERGVEVLLAERALRLEGGGAVERVVTDRRTIETDLVIVAVGVQPNADLAREAGLALTSRGAIQVNARFQTSDPDIYAGGDCIENVSLVTGGLVYTPMGSLANRQGRIIGTNLAGLEETFDGVVGSFILKIFDLTVAGAGLSLPRAKAEGLEVLSVLVVQGDRAHFYPGMELLYLELIVERPGGRVLGIQGLSPQGEALATRVNAVAALLGHRPYARDVAQLELAYSPPYAMAMDVVNVLGNVAENTLAGLQEVVEVDEFARLLEGRESGQTLFLDVRGAQNARAFVEAYGGRWMNIPQEELAERLGEVPRDKDLIVICNNGARSYEALLALKQAGLSSRNLQGGVGALKRWGWKIP